jgi:DNA-binding CsgD family transcriptional regulator
VTTEQPELVGRSGECAAIGAALDGPGSVAAALVLTGDAGIGKTALWEWAVARSAAAGAHVLLSRASAAEARLPWVGMTDLLRGVPDSVLDTLPEPQQRAIRAVSLKAGGADAFDERAVGTALLSTLQCLAESAPVLLAIDDLPYVDSASTSALAFALRRLEGRHPTRMLATARAWDGRLPLTQGLASARVDEMTVGPLSVGALFELLKDRTGIRLARPLLLRVHETSGGNPLYALELARALDRVEITPQPGSPLPVPTSLTALVDARVRDLDDDVREIVAATAAAWRFTGTATEVDAIERAVRAGLVVVDEATRSGGSRVVRSTHPLLGAAAYEGLSDQRRRALHERLAGVADDPVERVRHLALAAAEPRAEVADALDAGVVAALAAGVPDVAVELAQLSLEHTLDDGLRPARLDRLADARLRAGDSSGAWQAQSTAMELTAPGPLRARRRIRLAEIVTEVTNWADAERELERAVLEAEGDDVVLSEVLLTLAAITEDISLADSSAQRAVALLDALDDPDPVILSGALAQAAGARFRAGRGLDHEMFQRAIDIERRHPYRRLSDRADASYAALLKYADDLDQAQARLSALVEEARAIGDISSIAYSLAHLGHISLWRGDLAVGRAYADEHVEVAAQGELVGQGAQARYNLGLALAYQGELGEAAAVLANVLDDPNSNGWMRHRAHATLGFVELSRGDPVASARHLDRWYEALTAMHFGEPGYSRSHLDYLCALVGSGRLADAEVFRSELEGQAQRSGRESAAAVALTGSAMIDAAAGRTSGAQSAVASALAWYDRSPLRFDRARTLLIAGQIARRAKAKRQARDLLSEAQREFATFGATAWRAQAAAELARVNVRPGAPSTLTETERRVAELAAAGLTNREVADRMFLAIKTVEANLARVYRKLGIRSRAELGAQMGPAVSE